MSDTLAQGIAAAGLFISLAALLLILFLDTDDEAHRDARRRNQAHPKKRGHR